jgi:hypothetical protein
MSALKYTMNMEKDRHGGWVEAKDYEQLESEFNQYKTWAEERIETLEHDLAQVSDMYEGLRNA